MSPPDLLANAMAEALRGVIREELARALGDQAATAQQRISLDRAARLVKRRRIDVLSACRSGEIDAKQDGSRWRVKVASLRRWANQ